MLIWVTSDGTSTVIGMRGSFMIKIEVIPTIVKSNEDRMMIEKSPEGIQKILEIIM